MGAHAVPILGLRSVGIEAQQRQEMVAHEYLIQPLNSYIPVYLIDHVVWNL